jgi:hypothetical protein
LIWIPIARSHHAGQEIAIKQDENAGKRFVWLFLFAKKGHSLIVV